MEWLKDKKNLPIVVAIAVFVILAAGGFSAYTLGLFPSGQSASDAPAGAPSPPAPGVAPAPDGSTSLPPGALPGPGGPGTPAIARASKLPAAKAVVVKKPVSDNPAIGPDPFYIPGGQKIAAAQTAASTAAVKLPLRNMIAPLNLFQIHTPAPPASPSIPGLNTQAVADPAANYRLAGVITGSDGINAILEVGGQSQSVKPGDSLPDGSRVQNIQTTSITLRTAGGSVISLPLSAGTPDQGTANPYGQPQFPPGFNGQIPSYGPPPNQQGQGADN